MATRDRRDLLDPFSQFRRLSEQMNRWFDSVDMGRIIHRPTGPSENRWTPNAPNTWAPELETFLHNDRFVVRMDLPGVNKEDVNVEITDEAIVIHGERQQTHQEERDGFYRSERTYGRFYREAQLPEGAQTDSATASYRDGVLEISVTAPPRQPNPPRRVEIGGASIRECDECEHSEGGSNSEPVAIAPDAGRGSSHD